jgi:hypothetical protein
MSERMRRDTVIIWAACVIVGLGLGYLLAQLIGNSTLIVIGAILGVGAAFFVSGMVKGPPGG